MDNSANKVILIEKKRVYDGFFKMDRYTLSHSTPKGEMSPEITRELFERGNAAAVLVYDRAADTVLLVEEFRIGNLGAGLTGADAWSFAPIAGMIEPGESGFDCIMREAREEAGITLDPSKVSGPWRYLSSPGGTSEVLDIFLAQADLSAIDLDLVENDGDEFTHPVAVPRIDVMASLASGTVPASLMVAMLWLDKTLAGATDMAV